jgi:Rrf2 family transcriptional regulator, iron-sulfur cluster assembly transcription factor
MSLSVSLHQQLTMFSKACEYGIRATIFIASESLDGRRTSLKDIASEIDSPVAFTAKVLQLLARNEIVDSVKGPSGGFEISRKKMEKIKLSFIVQAIDGDRVYTGCGLGLKACSDKHPCPAHYKFIRAREALRQMLESTTVYELSRGHNEGTGFLKK